MPRSDGHTNLIAAHPGNTNAVRHGAYSGRILAERAAEIAAALMTLPHLQPLDVLAAEEIGSLVATLEAIDKDIAARPQGVRGVRLLEHKARCGRELRNWLREIGATPASRVEVVAKLNGDGGLGAEIRRRLTALEDSDDN